MKDQNFFASAVGDSDTILELVPFMLPLLLMLHSNHPVPLLPPTSVIVHKHNGIMCPFHQNLVQPLHSATMFIAMQPQAVSMPHTVSPIDSSSKKFPYAKAGKSPHQYLPKNNASTPRFFTSTNLSLLKSNDYLPKTTKLNHLSLTTYDNLNEVPSTSLTILNPNLAISTTLSQFLSNAGPIASLAQNTSILPAQTTPTLAYTVQAQNRSSPTLSSPPTAHNSSTPNYFPPQLKYLHVTPISSPRPHSSNS